MESNTSLDFDLPPGLEAASLESRIRFLIDTYQSGRNVLLAWMVVSYAQVLSRHPDIEVSEEQRCVYRRLAQQWRLLARSGETDPATPLFVVREAV